MRTRPRPRGAPQQARESTEAPPVLAQNHRLQARGGLHYRAAVPRQHAGAVTAGGREAAESTGDFSAPPFFTDSTIAGIDAGGATRF
ncbi:hypothetical protein NDU88_008846 [Pleurodeles waltl]|uniref:Uncharacterized protein n=1 Tax=Pleurodeles waltl TaxID=8319 RepID=A0AAV7QSY3_PLEWA|nr:hypothetical protein NDU88_008846 [Pleurodeles waltl]